MRDNYGRNIVYLRWSVTDECNLRCYYCTLKDDTNSREYLTIEEMRKLVKIFKTFGFRYVRLTGGEPTVRRDIVDIVKIMNEGFSRVSMTTNGTLLSELAFPLKRAGLFGVNISLDTLDPETFLKISGTSKLSDVIDGVEESLKAGLNVKLNTVLLKENRYDIVNLVRFAIEKNTPIRFIELMPFGKVKKEDFVSENEAMEILKSTFELTRIDDRLGEGPASYYRVFYKNKNGIVGFISSITHNFCDSCNKIRISARGEIIPCLAHPFLKVNLKPVMSKSAKELKAKVLEAIKLKPLSHDFRIDKSVNFSMKNIGG